VYISTTLLIKDTTQENLQDIEFNIKQIDHEKIDHEKKDKSRKKEHCEKRKIKDNNI